MSSQAVRSLNNGPGYNFPNLEAITPYLEPSSAGPSTAWAKRTAARLDCIVNVGYPEITSHDPPQRYNTVVSVSPTGEIIATYRKTFLYYTDETWALEGDTGFYNGILGRLGQACMGICMDINPKRFEAPYEAYEFATHCVEARTPLVVLSMAWLTRLEPREITETAAEPDLDTLSYWLGRFFPVIAAATEEEMVLVLANRCGIEPGSLAGISQGVSEDGEEVVSYAGSSCVLRVKGGNVQIYDLLGKAEEKVLIVDMDEVSKHGTSCSFCQDQY